MCKSKTATYKQAIHITLASMLNFACKYMELGKNVAIVVGNYKKKKGEIKNKINYLTEKEFNSFIEYESNATYKDFFTILFYTGMRRGELLALEITDVDFEKNVISITKSINPKNGKGSTVPKTDESNRNIKMLNIVRETLLKYVNKNNTIIFGLENIKLTKLQRKCDRNCKSANILKNIRIHDFRHSFATLCINKETKPELISEYLEHENISTTLNTYAHLYPDSQNRLIEILENNTKSNVGYDNKNFINKVLEIVENMLAKGKNAEEIRYVLNEVFG